MVKFLAGSLALSICFSACGLQSPQSENAVAERRPASFEERVGFEHDEWSRKALSFWISIYSQYTTEEGLIHDARFADRVFEVLNFSGMDRRARRRKIQESRKHWREVLLRVDKKQDDVASLDSDEKKVFDLYPEAQDRGRFMAASRRKRIRFQLGQKNRFRDALIASGQYLKTMEQIFDEEGVPRELTRIPFVESSFNFRARSKVQAAGVWQFIKSTGRLYLKIDDNVDQRNDPWIAARAAARLFRQNYESLQNWPLAVVAYNHGRMGLVRAVRQVGSSEFNDIVQEFKGKRFGFASRNFFMEFLAAVEVERNSSRYFPDVERAKLIEFFEVQLPRPVRVRELVKKMGISQSILRDYNPSYSDDIWQGRAAIPMDVSLRLPRESTGDDPRVEFFEKFNRNVKRVARKSK